jgi:hypothetical protein
LGWSFPGAPLYAICGSALGSAVFGALSTAFFPLLVFILAATSAWVEANVPVDPILNPISKTGTAAARAVEFAGIIDPRSIFVNDWTKFSPNAIAHTSKAAGNTQPPINAASGFFVNQPAAAGGDIDPAFNPGGAGADSDVLAVAVQPGGKIVIGGRFTSYNGDAAASDHVMRLNADGTRDTTFNAGGAGADNGVNAVAVQPDGKIVIVGSRELAWGWWKSTTPMARPPRNSPTSARAASSWPATTS